MKEQLNRENIEALSAYRFLRAKETLKEIPYLYSCKPSLLCLLLCSSRSAY